MDSRLFATHVSKVVGLEIGNDVGKYINTTRTLPAGCPINISLYIHTKDVESVAPAAFDSSSEMISAPKTAPKTDPDAHMSAG